MIRKQAYHPLKTKYLGELHYLSAVTLLISYFFFQLSYGQLKNQEKESYLWFDEVLGPENVNLYNGLNYIEKYKTKNGNHKFFNSENTLPNSLIIYEGQPYYNVKIKYDSFEDQVLVVSNNVVQLTREHVSSFTINENRFVYLDTASQDTRFIPGFYEILTETPSYTLYKKHRKKPIKRIDQNTNYFEFFDDNQYYVHYLDAYHKIKTKRDLLKIFTEFKKEIKANSKKISHKLDLESYLLNTLPKINFIKSETANLEQ